LQCTSLSHHREKYPANGFELTDQPGRSHGCGSAQRSKVERRTAREHSKTLENW
jgi:hypothetical protein